MLRIAREEMGDHLWPNVRDVSIWRHTKVGTVTDLAAMLGLALNCAAY